MGSLEDKLQTYPGPVQMLRNAKTGPYEFPFAPQYTNWQDEQLAWQKSVVLFDQSFHMTDLIHRLVDAGQRVVSFPVLEYWLDIGEPLQYAQAQNDVKLGRLVQ